MIVMGCGAGGGGGLGAIVMLPFASSHAEKTKTIAEKNPGGDGLAPLSRDVAAHAEYVARASSVYVYVLALSSVWPVRD